MISSVWQPRSTAFALLLTLALTATACNLARRGSGGQANQGPVQYGEGLATESPGAPGKTTVTPPPAATKKSGSKPATGGGPTAALPATGGGTALTSINDAGRVGSAARGLLRPEPYREIVVEIDFAEGVQVFELTKTYIKSKLEAITGKKVTFEGGNSFTRRGGSTSIEQMTRIAEQNRTVHSEPPRAALWIGFVNGRAAEASGIEGAVIAGSVFAATYVRMFPDSYRGGLPTDDDTEATILLHEIGHLLAMTEIVYDSPRDHRDCEDWYQRRQNHNRFKNSVMYKSGDTTDIIKFIINGPLDFDGNDLADLADLRNSKEKASGPLGSC